MHSGDVTHIDLHVVVFGRAQGPLEGHLKEALQAVFAASDASMRVSVSHYPRIVGSFNVDRQQHASGPYLHFLDVFNPNEPDSIKLGLIDEDLYSDSHASLNFIFGEARVGGECCVVSTARLDPRFYDLRYNEKLYHVRAVKEAVHEIGHVFGLTHCDDVRCIMHFSNCIEDTDIKQVQPCSSCEGKMRGNVKKWGKMRITREPGSAPGSRP